MFLAGYDGTTPELRSPSIKGMMRFWWRALNGYLSLYELKKKEGEIFGSSDKEIGRSKINIQVTSKRLEIGEYYILPHKSNFKPRGLSPGQKISISLSFYDNIDEYSNILKVSLLLGGLGKRSRRGFGSVNILKVNKEAYNIEFNIQEILRLINTIGNNKYKLDGKKILLEKNISQDYPFVREILLGNEYPSWENLLETIGVASHKCKDESLGFAHNGKRLASPIYVSVLKISNDRYIPIITTLNTEFENKHPANLNIQNKFKGMII